LGKRLLLALFPPLGALLIWAIYRSCRKYFHLPQTPLDPTTPYIFVFWHGQMLMQFFLYRKVRGDHPVAVIISEHRDGELIVRIGRYFQVEAVRGSSRKGGVKALIGALRLLARGYDLAITPDGPKGPRHTIAPGVLALARKSGAAIVALGFVPSRYWQLSSWDRFLIPKPFSRIDFYVSEPLAIGDLDDNEAREQLFQRLMQVSKLD